MSADIPEAEYIAASRRCRALYQATTDRLRAAGCAVEATHGRLAWAPGEGQRGLWHVFIGGRPALELPLMDRLAGLGDLPGLEAAALAAADQAMAALTARLGGEER